MSSQSVVRGYARSATKQEWIPGQSQSVVHVREVAALDAPASALLYRHLFDQDLMGKTDLRNVAVDDPLLLWLDNIRVASPRRLDARYARLIDLPVALRSRTYARQVDLVLGVTERPPGALATASDAFQSSPAPWCPVIF